MTIDRRQFAGAAAIGAAALLHGASAEAAAKETNVEQAVEALRKALLAADEAELDRLTAAELSYGHSDGRVQSKAEFIDGVANRKALLRSLTFPELKITLAGDAAIARHLYAAETETAGKPASIKLGVLAVWHNRRGGWKLLARQGYKLA